MTFARVRPTAWLFRSIRLPALCFLSALLTGCYVDTPPMAPHLLAERLTKLLTDSSAEVRRTAAESLGKIGAKAAGLALRARLTDADPRVRAAAAKALGRVNDAESGSALIRSLSDSSEAVRSAAAVALGDLDLSPDQVTRLIDVLSQTNTVGRLAAGRALIGLDQAVFSAGLAQGLRDHDPAVRQAVAAALGESADGRAVPLLLSLVRTDPDAGVRVEAAFRLGKLGGVREAAALDSVMETDADRGVRRWAAWARRQITAVDESGSARRPGR